MSSQSLQLCRLASVSLKTVGNCPELCEDRSCGEAS